MKYVGLVLGDETIKVSKLCFGSLCIGPLQSGLSLKDGAEVIRRAIGSGVNFIDTAQLYGTYKYIRAAFEKCNYKYKYNYNINADSIIISTKTYAYTRKLAEEALKEALSELNRDYIDIFMLHEQESLNTIRGHTEALEYLFEQKEAGKIRAVGISTHHVGGVLGAIEFNGEYTAHKNNAPDKHKKYNKLDVIHPIYNISGLGIIGTGSSGDGDYLSHLEPVSHLSHLNLNHLNQMEAALLKAKESGFFIFSMKALGGGNLFSRAEEALNFVLNKPFIDSVAVGMKSILEVDANVEFFKTGRFTGEYYANYPKIKKSLHIDGWCAGCGNCVKLCPAKALKISGGKAVCDCGKCVLCGYCSSACRDFAVKII